ncbi:dTDP-4-dehydrorhamnose 3,5-epimerase-like enzyme [Bifidobacterium commune]|nr:dTDP-4-dehydrorhamnose 3,5-epimerase-like enzyme [Bifidobacterium commune]
MGNSFQVLQDGTVYAYLVNAHWSLEQKKAYVFVNMADPDLGIDWLIPPEKKRTQRSRSSSSDA